MKWTYWVLFLGFLLALSGCGVNFKVNESRDEKFKSPASLSEMKIHRYAFSAEVKDLQSGKAIPNFSIESLAGRSKFSAIINALGSKTGVFHISRNPSVISKETIEIPFLISAPGFEPAEKQLAVGADCRSANCVGKKALEIFLQPLEGNSAQAAITDNFIPRNLSNNESIANRGQIFENLVESGRIGSRLSEALASSRNGDLLGQVLVLLNENGSSSASKNSLANALLSALPAGISTKNIQGLPGGTIASLLASSSPEVAAALLAVNRLLPYLKPIVESRASGPQARPFAKLLLALLNSPDLSQSLGGLAQGLSANQKGRSAQLAMSTFIPFMTNLLGKRWEQLDKQKPYSGLFSQALLNRNFFQSLTNPQNRSDTLKALAPFIQNLVHGLAGKNSPLLSSMLNTLLSGGKPIEILKNFPSNSQQADRFAELLPYLTPIVQGLNGDKQSELSQFLAPLLEGTNPAEQIAALLKGKSDDSQSAASRAQIASALFPALSSVLTQWAPRKQLIGSQLLNGLIRGDFTDLRITNDLSGSPAVLVSGRAQDVLKLIQLPNVSRASLVQ